MRAREHSRLASGVFSSLSPSGLHEVTAHTSYISGPPQQDQGWGKVAGDSSDDGVMTGRWGPDQAPSWHSL